MLQPIDGCSGVVDVLAFGVYARPQQQEIGVIAGEAFGHPQLTSINFAGIVERSEDSGPDPFHVPQMKIFVSGDKKKSAIRRLVDEVVFPYGDARGIEMLHTTAPSLRKDFHKERIVLVGKLP